MNKFCFKQLRYEILGSVLDSEFWHACCKRFCNFFITFLTHNKEWQSGYICIFLSCTLIDASVPCFLISGLNVLFYMTIKATLSEAVAVTETSMLHFSIWEHLHQAKNRQKQISKPHVLLAGFERSGKWENSRYNREWHVLSQILGAGNVLFDNT